jgi:outer membrane protein assembly factor BamA
MTEQPQQPIQETIQNAVERTISQSIPSIVAYSTSESPESRQPPAVLDVQETKIAQFSGSGAYCTPSGSCINVTGEDPNAFGNGGRVDFGVVLDQFGRPTQGNLNLTPNQPSQGRPSNVPNGVIFNNGNNPMGSQNNGFGSNGTNIQRSRTFIDQFGNQITLPAGVGGLE